MDSGLPTKSQNMDLPAIFAAPMPDGPPFTGEGSSMSSCSFGFVGEGSVFQSRCLPSFVTSVVSAWPINARIPRILACLNSSSSSKPSFLRRSWRTPELRRKPSASIARMATSGSHLNFSSPVAKKCCCEARETRKKRVRNLHIVLP